MYAWWLVFEHLTQHARVSKQSETGLTLELLPGSRLTAKELAGLIRMDDMPSLTLFNQNAIVPSLQGQMVQQPDTHHSSANDDYS